MANTFRIKRRLVGGAVGAPASLLNAELAFNEQDMTLYYGKGISTGVTAASVVAIAGPGALTAYSQIAASETITGNKNFTGTVDVPTVTGASNSTSAASTAWVRGFAQPLAATLTALAALSTTGIHVQTGASSYATRTITGTSSISVTNGDGVAGNPTLALPAQGSLSAGTYAGITFNSQGIATAATALTSSNITTALGYTPENVANKGVANGYASLDSGGKVPTSQLPSSVTGGLQYQGGWNASTNSPTITNGTGTTGYYYKVTTAGNTTIDGNNNWTAGDLIVYNGTTWDKFEGGSPDVVSVAGKVGVVTLSNTDISGLGTMSTQNANSVAITGGSVAGSTITGNISGNAANVTGTVAVGNGGTGAVTLTGYVKGTGTAALTASATIPNTDITGLGTMSTQSASSVNITGGTVAASTISGNISGNAANVTGTVAVANGGTGAVTLTGYLKGNGTSAVTASASIPNTDISGLGTMSTQNASAVAITGGTIDGVTMDGGTF